MDKQPSSIATDKTDPAVGFAVTLSGLLNVLDGFHAPENVIYVMTTNKIKALDPALLRPGRIDYRLFMGEASEPQRIELYRRFFPDATEAEAREFAQAHFAETMAEFQGLLLTLEQRWGILEPASVGCGGKEPSFTLNS
jgi:mitochondrial chaperone BCS1